MPWKSLLLLKIEPLAACSSLRAPPSVVVGIALTKIQG
jgi:hypothetical protein